MVRSADGMEVHGGLFGWEPVQVANYGRHVLHWEEIYARR